MHRRHAAPPVRPLHGALTAAADHPISPTPNPSLHETTHLRSPAAPRRHALRLLGPPPHDGASRAGGGASRRTARQRAAAAAAAPGGAARQPGPPCSRRRPARVQAAMRRPTRCSTPPGTTTATAPTRYATAAGPATTRGAAACAGATSRGPCGSFSRSRRSCCGSTSPIIGGCSACGSAKYTTPNSTSPEPTAASVRRATSSCARNGRGRRSRRCSA